MSASMAGALGRQVDGAPEDVVAVGCRKRRASMNSICAIVAFLTKALRLGCGWHQAWTVISRQDGAVNTGNVSQPVWVMAMLRVFCGPK